MSSSYESRTFADIARQQSEELRRREAEGYEKLLRDRFKQRYPKPTPEEQRKIEARVKLLMERDSREIAERPPVQRFEQQLRERLAARYPDLSPTLARRLEERIVQAVERQKAAFGEVRLEGLDEMMRKASRVHPTQERHVYGR
jgi:hypothetical protein